MRRARDRSLPYGLRASMFHSCVQLYRPLGFHTTIGFLESRTGSVRQDERALLEAPQLLEHSRAVCSEQKTAYAAVRTAPKQAGQRVPSARLPNAYWCDRWHADPHPGAVYAIEYWQRNRRPLLEPADETVLSIDGLVESCLRSAPRQDPDAAAQVQSLTRSLGRQQTWPAFREAPRDYLRRHSLPVVLHHLTIAHATG